MDLTESGMVTPVIAAPSNALGPIATTACPSNATGRDNVPVESSTPMIVAFWELSNVYVQVFPPERAVYTVSAYPGPIKPMAKTHNIPRRTPNRVVKADTIAFHCFMMSSLLV